MKNMNRCINSLHIIANQIIDEAKRKGKTGNACKNCAYMIEPCWSMDVTCAEGIIKKLMEQRKHEYNRTEIR